MKAEDLKNSILQLAMEGKLVPQNPNDEPASVLLDKIREEKEQLINEKKIKRNNKESFIFRKNGHFYEKVGKKGEPLCIDDEIPFEIPKNWIWYRLNVFANIIMGQSPKGEFVVDNGEGIEFHQGKIFFGEKFLNKSDKGAIKPSKLSPKNSILLCVRAPVGVINICDREICIGRGLTSIKPFIDDCFNYLYYFLLTQEIRYKSKATGSTFKAIKKEIVENTLIPVPPLNEQIRIIDKIEALLPLIYEYGEKEERLNQLNKDFPNKLRNSILQEAIQGKLVPQNPNDEPASVLLEKIKEEKERLIKEKKIKRNKNESFIYKMDNHFYEKIGDNEPVCIDDEIPFDIPDSWAWVRLDSVCKYIQRGKSPKYSEIKKFPVVAQKCNQWSGFSLEKAKFIDPKTVDSYNEERILQNKDIMWNSTGLGTLGRVGLYDESVNKYGWAVADSHVTIIRPFAEYILQEFIYLFLASPTVQLVIESKAGGSTKQKELNLSTIKNYLIPLAPYNEQKNIIEKVHNLNKLIE